MDFYICGVKSKFCVSFLNLSHNRWFFSNFHSEIRSLLNTKQNDIFYLEFL